MNSGNFVPSSRFAAAVQRFDAANAAGGPDNITVVLLQIDVA